MDKFKVGDKVRIVKSGFGIVPEDVGKTTTIKSLPYKSRYSSEDAPRYDFDDGPLSRYYDYGASEDSFELEERSAEPTPADLLTITWQGATITFDPAISAGEKMVQSIVAMIYKEAVA